LIEEVSRLLQGYLEVLHLATQYSWTQKMICYVKYVIVKTVASCGLAGFERRKCNNVSQHFT
jgi:hypothetical protein